MKIDFAFIPTYALVFVLMGCLLFLRGGYWRWAGILVGLLGCSAAVFDAWENIRILGVLEGAGETPRCVSLIKWTLIFALLPGVACAYLEQSTTLLRRAVGFLAAGLSWGASLFGIAGVLSGVNPLIERGVELMSASLFLGWFYFATHAVLADGLLPALNRLAAWCSISRLTNSPSDKK